MTGISALTGLANSQSQAAKGLSDTFDTFLKLLTAQLQNQDPLSPMDSAKFTEQLVQYSQVEQQIAGNDKLDALTALLQANSASAPLSYLGTIGTFESNLQTLTEDGATWKYALGDASVSTKITVKNSSGAVVYTTTGERAAGAHEFAWDGTLTGGGDAPEGLYRLEVEALDGEGKKIDTAIAVEELITGVDFSADPPNVTTASGARAIDGIIRVQKPT